MYIWREVSFSIQQSQNLKLHNFRNIWGKKFMKKIQVRKLFRTLSENYSDCDQNICARAVTTAIHLSIGTF